MASFVELYPYKMTEQQPKSHEKFYALYEVYQPLPHLSENRDLYTRC